MASAIQANLNKGETQKRALSRQIGPRLHRHRAKTKLANMAAVFTQVVKVANMPRPSGPKPAGGQRQRREYSIPCCTAWRRWSRQSAPLNAVAPPRAHTKVLLDRRNHPVNPLQRHKVA